MVPLHKAFVALAVNVTEVGWVIDSIELVLHAFASVATTVYVPTEAVYGLDAVVPLTVYVIAPLPPVAPKVKLPEVPLHKGLVAKADNTTEVGSVTVKIEIELHEFASVAMIVYVPATVTNGLDCDVPFTV